MPGQYLYNVEFTVNDIDLWVFPEELKNPENFATVTRFKMDPSICLEIGEEEFIDQINCGLEVVKNAMFSLGGQQIKNDVNGKIVVSKSKCSGNEVLVGCYKMSKLHCSFRKLTDEFDKQAGSPCAKQPCFVVIKELVQLVNEKDQPSGSVHYTLRLTCFGPSISRNRFDDFESKTKLNDVEAKCLDKAAKPCPCPQEDHKEVITDPGFDEYSAEVNGNQLIVRISKDDSSHLVTRVFDSNMDLCGNEIQGDKNAVSICGCGQQIDFKFPGKFSCGDCRPKARNCSCALNSSLTDFQRQTSCLGKSFKNSFRLPIIRGNLKYPGRLDDSIKFDLYDKCNPTHATEKYKTKPQQSRGVCLQVDGENLKQELNGKCKLPRGISVCKKGCDSDTDVFVLKIGREQTDKKGRKNEIELEMRTPKGPDNEIKKKETREVQVDEKDFIQTKVPTKKVEISAPVSSKLASKGFVKKKK